MNSTSQRLFYPGLRSVKCGRRKNFRGELASFYEHFATGTVDSFSGIVEYDTKTLDYSHGSSGTLTAISITGVHGTVNRIP